MANKVISIKMDEEDIERLKKYHALLSEFGFVSKGNLTFNAFLKHILMDNLVLDFIQMCDAYSECGEMPVCLNPECVGGEKLIKLPNLYGFDEEEYQAYQKCFIDALYKITEKSEKDAAEMQKILGIGVEWSKGVQMILSVFREEDTLSEFWSKKVGERRELVKREEDNSERSYMDRVVKESELTESMKARIANKIETWHQNEQMMRNGLRRW